MERNRLIQLIDIKWLLVFLSLNVADCILTGLNLNAGAQEMNPVLSSFGMPGLVAVKMSIVALTSLLICYLGKKWLSNAAIWIMALVVAYNSTALMLNAGVI